MKAILTFHSIDTRGSVLSFPPRAFACLLGQLVKSCVPILGLDELLSPQTKTGITFTFDDGARSVLTHALPVLRDHGVTAHLFLTTNAIAGDNQWAGQPSTAPHLQMMDWSEIERLQAGGVWIESHTHHHPDLRQLNETETGLECDLADELIETRLGRRPHYFSYPYGYRNQRVCNTIRERYRGAVTTELRSLRRHEDAAQLPRLDAHYLRNHWLHQNLDSTLAGMYLSLRNLLRTLRGTQ